MNGSVKEPNISIYFFFLPITQWCSISDVLFTSGRGVSDFSLLKYYLLNINYSVNILSECLCILIDCSQLSKTYYNVLFGSSIGDRHVLRIYRRTFIEYASCMTNSGGRTD